MDDRQTCGASFGEEHFGNARLGDRRRTRRLVQLADRIVMHPGGTLPEKIDDPASLKALYRLMNQADVTHASVFASSRERTLRLVREVEGTVLLIHDGTEFDFSGLRSLEGLGRIGNGNCRGYLAHNVLAVVAETRDVIGLAYQKLAKRPKANKKETRRQTRERPDRLSRFWRDASATIPAASAGRRQIEVADRGADILEFLDFVESQGKSYLVRSQYNRRISLKNGEETKLHDYARRLPVRGHNSVEVQATKRHAARTARVSIAWSQLTLLVPKQPRGEIRGVPLTCWVVCVREVDPPDGVEPLEWILLSNVPVGCLQDARERIGWYQCRWIIEEYHKAVKTGCGVETLQFTTEDGLQPAIALISVTALFLLNLRSASRRADAKERLATDLLPETCVEMLSLWRYRQPRPDMTVYEFYYALARLGGHQNRRHDHPPGWLVLWRGWTKLQPMLEAAAILRHKKCG
jgi:hypothetical protein